MNICQNDEQRDGVKKMCASFIHQLEDYGNEIKGQVRKTMVTKGQTTFYGEYETNTTSNKRHKATYEKFHKWLDKVSKLWIIC